MFVEDGYVQPDDDDDLNPKPWAASAEVYYYNLQFNSWAAKLLSGILFEFRPGVKYDVAFLDHNGWINICQGLIFTGVVNKVGQFMAPAATNSKSPDSQRVIVAAKLSS